MAERPVSSVRFDRTDAVIRWHLGADDVGAEAQIPLHRAAEIIADGTFDGAELVVKAGSCGHPPRVVASLRGPGRHRFTWLPDVIAPTVRGGGLKSNVNVTVELK